jgi:hypothetical protein
MWHMPVTAPPAPPGTTNYYSATIEIYVVNTDTGEEVTNSGTSFVLTWSDVPDGRPALAINPAGTNSVVLSWPASAANWSLVSSTNLSSTNWTTVTNAVISSNGQSAVYLDGLAAQQFFRLRRNP